MTNPLRPNKIVGKPVDDYIAWCLEEPLAKFWPAGDPVSSDRETLVTLINRQYVDNVLPLTHKEPST